MSADKKNLGVWIHGISGRMGQILKSEIEKKALWSLLDGSDHRSSPEALEEGLKKASLIIDFSSAEGNQSLFEGFKRLTSLEGKSLVICSTGLTDQQKQLWTDVQSNKKFSVLFAPNTSLGILMLMKSALNVVGLTSHAGFDIEIEETHHKHKKDIPSGTALFLAEALQNVLPDAKLVNSRNGERKSNEIGIMASRGGGVFGEHKIRFLGEFEEFTLTHRAFSRQLFAKGAVILGEWLIEQSPRVYTLHDIKLSKW